jgi:hypothetical protein
MFGCCDRAFNSLMFVELLEVKKNEKLRLMNFWEKFEKF